ncbi:MAG: serine hydrolase [Planctomycetes bacterium]|nr:serine hydrolase [Planctomycetota bacterium]
MENTKNRLTVIFIIINVMLCFASIVFAADNNSTESQIDQIFAEWDTSSSPGCAVAVFKNNKIEYHQSYGLMDLESKTPITPDTVFDIGSMSKQFTAACIILLAEQGKLSLTDNIRKDITEFPDYGNTITIQHLLNNTSGIRDYTWLMVLARMPFEDQTKRKTEEILNLLSRQNGLQFNPGDEYYYSNSNYFLLGIIIERETGITVGEFADKNIFKPLEMNNTVIHESRSQIIKNAAKGYVPDPNRKFKFKRSGIMKGAGGVHSTIKDMFRWDQNFIRNNIGGKDFLNTFTTPAKLNNGRNTQYACGLEIKNHKGLKTIGHTGYTESFSTNMTRFPDQNITVVCLANFGGIRAERLALKVADLYLADYIVKAEAPNPTKKPATIQRTEIELEPSIIEAYAGDYRFDFGLLMKFTNENGRLMMKAGPQPKVEFFPESVNKFFMKVADVQVEFKKDDSGKVNGITLYQGGNAMMAKRAAAIKPLTAEEISQFTGEYYSDELMATYSVVLKDDKLFVTSTRLDEPLRHVKKDAFAYSRGDITFTKNAENRIINFILEVKSERLSFVFLKRK